MRITLRSGLEGRYYGPQILGEPAGKGRLRLYEKGQEIAEVPDALVEDGSFKGTPEFKGGRTGDVEWTINDGVPDGARTTFPDGQTFVGSYEGMEPTSGTMTCGDGTA